MKLLFALGVLFPLSLAAVPLSIERDEHAELFTAWKHKYNKEYDTVAEEVARFNIWKDNLQVVMSHNARYELGLETFFLGMNIFADMRNDEFVAQKTGYRTSVKSRVPDHTPMARSVPASIDWRDYGYVTGVKDQGSCGSCWSFSTTGALEGQHKRATGKLVSLSEEQLVDCDTTNYGCDGGFMAAAFKYLEKHGSISEADYPYTAGDGQKGICQESGKDIAANVSGYVPLPHGNEGKLKEAVGTVGPCSVAIDSNHKSFQLYSGGVYYESACRPDYLTHALLAIGYGNYQGSDYWLVKNSWGTSWGMDGYIRMSRNKNNNCGIANEAGYPVV